MTGGEDHATADVAPRLRELLASAFGPDSRLTWRSSSVHDEVIVYLDADADADADPDGSSTKDMDKTVRVLVKMEALDEVIRQLSDTPRCTREKRFAEKIRSNEIQLFYREKRLPTRYCACSCSCSRSCARSHCGCGL
jgi:hypothetical protein